MQHSAKCFVITTCLYINNSCLLSFISFAVRQYSQKHREHPWFHKHLLPHSNIAVLVEFLRWSTVWQHLKQGPQGGSRKVGALAALSLVVFLGSVPESQANRAGYIQWFATVTTTPSNTSFVEMHPGGLDKFNDLWWSQQPQATLCGNAPTAFNFFETRSVWNLNLCLDVKHGETANVNCICWLYHCCRSPAQNKWNDHSSHLLVLGSCCWGCSFSCRITNAGYFGIIKVVGNETPRARPSSQGKKEI